MPLQCSTCGTEIASGRLVCPACLALVHAGELRRLAEQAERDTRDGRPAEALAAWRRALELLPPDSNQSKRIGEKIVALTREGEPKPAAPTEAASASTGAEPGKRKGIFSGIAAGVMLVLTKFKFALFFVLTKLKWLALGMSKGATLLTMLASIGVYWALWGWPFAVGFVISIYIHEMGHVAALDRVGIKATAPMFVPGFGAFVRLKQYPVSASEDAYVGLAGPVWGTGAALASFIVWYTTGYGLWGALAEWGARINLFNLMPLGTLDGGRGFRALSRGARLAVVALTVAAWLATHEGMLLLVAMVGGVRAFGDAPAENDRRAMNTFAVLIVALTVLATLPKWMGFAPNGAP
jgi:Zn-dependent protease